MKNLLLEKILRKLRYKKALKYLKKGRVLDFGCDDKSLKDILPQNCEYVSCEKNYAIIKGKFDTVFMLAVLEHIPYKQAYEVLDLLFNSLNHGGKLIMTTPSISCKWVLEILAFKLHLLTQEWVKEHNHYWSEKEFTDLAKKYGLAVKYKTFQLGMNQLIIFEKTL